MRYLHSDIVEKDQQKFKKNTDPKLHFAYTSKNVTDNATEKN